MQALAELSPAAVQTVSCLSLLPSASQSRRCHISCFAFSGRLCSLDSVRSHVPSRDSGFNLRGGASKPQKFRVYAEQTVEQAAEPTVLNEAPANKALVKREKWLLQPVGDGKLINEDGGTSFLSSFELIAGVLTIGRESGKADIVIPAATVSRVHARLEKKDGALYVTDLDSMNGTFVNNEKIRPGGRTPVSPGSRISFGDKRHTAFEFSKVEEEIVAEETDQSA